jgi:hypothetical protein
MVDVVIEEMVMGVDAAAAGVVPPPWSQGDLIEFPTPKRYPCMWCTHVDRCTAEGVDVAAAWGERTRGR